MRPSPEPSLLLMYDWENLAPDVRPAWGKFDSWMWWKWNEVNPGAGRFDWAEIDAYLDKAASLGKRALIGLQIYPGPNQDATPLWVYGGKVGGWPYPATGTPQGTYPKWNDPVWDAAYSNLVREFGALYDGDPRLLGVWIATGLWGECVFDQYGTSLMGHNPVRFVKHAIDWYDAAFPSTPLFVSPTGVADRRAICQYAWDRDVNIRFHNLHMDQPVWMMDRPDAGAGHGELAVLAGKAGHPMSYEHAYNGKSVPEGYWALLCAIAFYATTVDLPEDHLSALATIPGYWAWLLEMMSLPQERVGLYVARETRYPPPYTDGWTHGWLGPWERGISTNAACYAPATEAYLKAPALLRDTIEGYGGLGYCKDSLSVELSLPEGSYLVEVVMSLDGREWVSVSTPMASPGVVDLSTGPCWLHRVTAKPYDGEPDDDAIAALQDDVEDLQEAVTDLQADNDNQAARLNYLEAAINRMEARVAELEDTQRAIHDATASDM